MAVVENDYAAYIQTPDGEVPLRDLGALRTYQREENAGKILTVGSDGIVTPVEMDKTLTDNTKAAPAGVVGELKSDLSDLVSHKEFTGEGEKFYDLHFEVGKTYRFKSVTNGIAYVLKTVSEKSSSAVIDTITEGMPYGLTWLFQPTSEASILYVYSTGLGTLTFDEVGTTKDEVERLKNSEKVTFLLGSDGLNMDVFHFEKGYKYIVKNESETSAVQLWTKTDTYGSNIETISDALLAKSEIEFIPTLSTQYLLIYANGPATVTIKKITNIGFKLYESGQIHFTVPVNQKRLYDTQASGNTLIDSEADTVNVNCVCMLPKTYSPNGKSSKLLMICHGSGGGVTETKWFGDDTTVIDFFKKFVDDGYVIFDCNGYKNGTEGQEIWGNDRGVLAYRKAYEYMIEHYNVEHEMCIYAFSMGGLTALNYCNRFKNVKALAMGSPVCSLYNTIYVDQSVQAKGDVGRAYGFTQPTVYEVDKIDNCDPYARMITIGDKQYYPCDMPTTKIWHGDSDTAVYYQHSQELANAMRNTGKNVYYRIVEGKGHEICYGGNSVVINEILMFLRRF